MLNVNIILGSKSKNLWELQFFFEGMLDYMWNTNRIMAADVPGRAVVMKLQSICSIRRLFKSL